MITIIPMRPRRFALNESCFASTPRCSDPAHHSAAAIGALLDSKLPGNPHTHAVGDASRTVIRKDREGSLGMKVLRAAALMALLVAGPAYAQQKPPPPTDPPKSPTEIEREKSTDQAYKKSLGN